MWHTTLVGDDEQYTNSNRRVRFNGKGSNIHISDFAIIGKLNYRNDSEPNDGFGDSFGADSTISRIWVEHTKTGVWVNNSSNLVVEGCRFRNTIADGLNFCVGCAVRPPAIAPPAARVTTALLSGRRRTRRRNMRPVSMSSAIAPHNCHFSRTAHPSTAARATVLKIACSLTSPPAAPSSSARLSDGEY